MSEVSTELFEEVAKIVADPSIKPSRASTRDEKLRFYALYKRGTVGRLHPPYTDDDIDTDKRPKSKPGRLSFEARSKYEAWEKADEISSRAEGRKEYVKLAEEIVGDPVKECVKKHSS